MKTYQGPKGAPPVVRRPSDSRIVALIAVAEGAGAAVAEQLRRFGIETHLTPHYGAMASTLFDGRQGFQSNAIGGAGREIESTVDILFVLDLRISCGALEIESRLADYDAVLHAHMLSGGAWPKTLCLVDAEQTHPAWLHARPHLRATLLADEVETIVGDPRQVGWHESFVSALSSYLS